jgi:hypothetical protein
MRAGQLKDCAFLRDATGTQYDGTHFIGITDKDESIPYSEGLRSSAKISISSRWHPAVLPGHYWIQQGRDPDGKFDRIFLINGSSNPDGKQRDLVSSVTEFVGAPTLIVDADITVKCALTNYRAKQEEGHGYPGAAETERRQAEFASVQYKPVVGHKFILAGAVYRITEHDTESSDAIVSRVWVEFLQYEQL